MVKLSGLWIHLILEGKGEGEGVSYTSLCHTQLRAEIKEGELLRCEKP